MFKINLKAICNFFTRPTPLYGSLILLVMFLIIEWVSKRPVLNILTAFKDIATIFGIVIGGYVGIMGLKSWEKQLKGNQDYNLAKNIGLLTYKYKEALFALRHPAIWNMEYPVSSPNEMQSTKSEKDYQKIEYMYQNRWKKITELKPSLQEAILESQVIWGDDLREIFDTVFKLEWRVRQEISKYLESIKDKKSLQDPLTDEEFSLLYDSLDDDKDVIRRNFALIRLDIENYLKPKLKL